MTDQTESSVHLHGTETLSEVHHHPSEKGLTEMVVHPVTGKGQIEMVHRHGTLTVVVHLAVAV